MKLIELRNGFNKKYDIVLDFYLNRMDNSLYSRNINLKQFERIKKISKNYSEYEIGYSLSDPLEVKSILEKKSYRYFLISEVENIIGSYHRAKQDFLEKNNSGNFCKNKYIPELIEVYRDYSKLVEHGILFP
ncbi:MAG: hypothetical protein KDK36_15655 [Leptospiraceae bacterium]|nr:hypothetical protein [Leptospiraceae bacterium]